MVRVSHVLEARVLGDADWIAATEICQLCRIDLDAMMELAALGVVEPRETVPGEWQVQAKALPRLRVVGRSRGQSVLVELALAARGGEAELGQVSLLLRLRRVDGGKLAGLELGRTHQVRGEG